MPPSPTAWMDALAARRRAPLVLGLAAFVITLALPVPAEPLLLLAAVAAPRRAVPFAVACTAGSVLAGGLGYATGAVLFDALGRPYLALFGEIGQFERFATLYRDWGVWTGLVAGATLFPYKVASVLSGASGLSAPVFAATSAVVFGVRYLALALLARRLGGPLRHFTERRPRLAFALCAAALAGGFAASSLP